MSSKVVRRLLLASNPSSVLYNAETGPASGASTKKRKIQAVNKNKHQGLDHDSIPASSSTTSTMQDVVDVQVKFLLGIDKGNFTTKRTKTATTNNNPKKRRRKDDLEKNSSSRREIIVTNSRGSAALASKPSVPRTFNKNKHRKEEKEEYFRSIALQLQKADKQSKRKVAKKSSK
mmetsp:Transcript_6641/g.8597  ORF Transcript_6641/g.8597 Transcript_6641/m.8597 type:complete len:175 (+) Transcript_6641:106-630(+)